MRSLPDKSPREKVPHIRFQTTLSHSVPLTALSHQSPLNKLSPSGHPAPLPP